MALRNMSNFDVANCRFGYLIQESSGYGKGLCDCSPSMPSSRVCILPEALSLNSADLE